MMAYEYTVYLSSAIDRERLSWEKECSERKCGNMMSLAKIKDYCQLISY